MNKSNNITISIVTYFSDHLIFKRLDKLKKFKSIIVENSLKKELKTALENKYRLTKVILPNKNMGYGGGNNLAINKIKTKYCLILNPDAYLEEKDLKNLLKYISELPEFGILFPRANNIVSKNYFKKLNKNYAEVYYDNFLKFSSGCCMLINIELLKKKKNWFF